MKEDNMDVITEYSAKINALTLTGDSMNICFIYECARQARAR